MKPDLSIQSITHFDEELFVQWKQLWDVSENATIFNSPEWFQAFIEEKDKNNYKIIACYENNKLVGILPLKKSKKFGFTVLSVINTKFQVDTAFLVEKYDRQIIKELFAYLITKETFFIQKIDSQAASFLHKLFPELFFSLISVNPCINLTSELYSDMSPKLLKRIKKLIQNNAGQFHFNLYKENLNTHLETMFSIDTNSWKQNHDRVAFSDNSTQNYIRTITKHCSNFMRIGILYYNNQPIAYFYGFLYKNTFAAYQTSFLNEYRHLRPGQTALYFLMQELQGKAIVIDMGGGLSRYKQEFTQNYRLLYDVYFSANHSVMIWWKAINLIRRIKQVILPKKNTDDHKFLFKMLSTPQDLLNNQPIQAF